MPKGPLDSEEKCGVIYECKCGECEQLYVGEMERSLSERTHQVTTGHKVLSKPLVEGVSVIDS